VATKASRDALVHREQKQSEQSEIDDAEPHVSTLSTMALRS
jgi:hypothetical protein